MFDPNLLVFHKSGYLGIAEGSFAGAEAVDEAVGACLCHWPSRATRRQKGTRLVSLVPRVLRAGAPAQPGTLRQAGGVSPSAHIPLALPGLSDGKIGSRKFFGGGAFQALAHVPLSRVGVKFRKEETAKERKNVFQMTLLVAC